MMFNTAVLVFISSAIGILCKTPEWHQPFETRFNSLEEKVNNESLEFRNELLSLLKKMQNCNTNAFNTSRVEPMDKPEVDSEETAVGEVSGTIAEALIAGFRAVKAFVRRSLLEFEQLVVKSGDDMSKSLENKEKGLRDEMLGMKRNLDRKIASGVKLVRDKVKSQAGILKILSNVENGLQDEITDIRSHVETKTASCSREMQEIKENMQAEFKNELNQLKEELSDNQQEKASSAKEMIVIAERIQAAFNSEINSLKRELLDIRQEFGEKYQRKCGLWHPFMDSCYIISAETATWEEARKSCLAMDAYLAEVDCAEENTFLKALAEDNESGGYGPWLGASDLDNEGSWRWSYSRRRIDDVYSGWNRYEPNGGRYENCLHLYRFGNYKWNDKPCSIGNSFICEK